MRSGGLTATTLAKLTVVAPADSPEEPPEDDGVIYVPGGATQQGFAAVDTHEAYLP